MSFLADAGAAFAVVEFLSGNQQRLSIVDNLTTSMSVSATTNINLTCFTKLDTSQEFIVNPGSNANFDTMGPLANSNCITIVNDIRKAREALEQAAVLNNPAYTAQIANPNLVTAMTTGSTDTNPVPTTTVSSLGPCTSFQANVVAINISQTSKLTASETCGENDTITTGISQSIEGQISAYLKNQQDIIGQLESSLVSNTESISTNLSTTLSQNITSNFIQSLNQTLKASQYIKVSGDSVLLDGVVQGFTGNMTGSLQVNNTVTDQLRQSAQYSIAQSLLNKNDSLSDITKDFLAILQTIDQIFESTVNGVIVIIACLVGSIILVVGGLYIFNKQFHVWFTNQVSSYADAKALHFRNMQTDPEYRKAMAEAESKEVDNRAKSNYIDTEKRKNTKLSDFLPDAPTPFNVLGV